MAILLRLFLNEKFSVTLGQTYPNCKTFTLLYIKYMYFDDLV